METPQFAPMTTDDLPSQGWGQYLVMQRQSKADPRKDKLCVRETSAELGDKASLDLDPTSEAGPELGWAGGSGRGEPGAEQWVGLGSS